MHEDRSTPQKPPGITLGTVAGVPVYLSRSWFLIALLITFAFLPAARSVASQPAATLIAFSFAVFLYASVLVHELGHAITAKVFGLPVHSIVLHLLGGVTQLEREATRPGASFLIAAAGPLLSLVLAAAGLGALTLTDLPPVPELLLRALTLTNLTVGVFNLLPGLPLDGGFLVRAAVWKITGRDRTGTLAAAHAGRALALLVLAGGCYLATRGTGVDWMAVIWTAVLSSFMWITATQSIRAERVRDRIPLLQARRLGRRAVAVTAATPLAQALADASRAGAGALVVVDHDGRPTALVSERAVHAVPENRRPWISAGEVSRALTTATTLPADLSGTALIDAVRDSGAAEHLLVEPGGEIYGVLSTRDLERLLAQT
ncbi:site-2 protease family protein [Actinocorallia libanotica]|uniref:site-2 protease family protein n=1 Tax=Actinocorallia libanotica TaxID=46162 RepID=UPI0031E2C0E1